MPGMLSANSRSISVLLKRFSATETDDPTEYLDKIDSSRTWGDIGKR